MAQHIAWLKELNKDSIAMIGKKATILAELSKIASIPPAFIIPGESFTSFLKQSNLDQAIHKKIKGMNIRDAHNLQQIAKDIHKLILQTPIPKFMQEQILEAYDALNVKDSKLNNLITTDNSKALVAVRSSTIAKENLEESFGGQQASYLNIEGNNKLLAAIKACWASLYTGRALHYRAKNYIAHKQVSMAIIVQRMINSEIGGLITTNDKEYLIEASYGMPQLITTGKETGDRFHVNRSTLESNKRTTAKKTCFLTRDPKTNEIVKKMIPLERQHPPCLSNYEIKALAEQSHRINEAIPVKDIEFAFEKGKVYITSVHTIPKVKEEAEEEIITESPKEKDITNATLLLAGTPLSSGNSKGKVVIVHDIDDLKRVEKGNIIVARKTHEDYASALELASGIIIDRDDPKQHTTLTSLFFRPCLEKCKLPPTPA